MATTTLTLALDGEVPFDRFATAVQHFCGLIYALTEELNSAERVDWFLADAIGRASDVTIVAESPSRESLAAIASMLLEVGKAVAGQQPIPFSDRVEGEAHALTRVLDGQITSLRLGTAENEVEIVGPTNHVPDWVRRGAYGSVEGRIVGYFDNDTPMLIMLDHLYHQPVTCYIAADQRRQIRGAWGRLAVVEGWLHRDRVTDRPLTVRDVTDITLLPEPVPGSFLRARGILPAAPGDPSPAELIRRLRDA